MTTDNKKRRKLLSFSDSTAESKIRIKSLKKLGAKRIVTRNQFGGVAVFGFLKQKKK